MVSASFLSGKCSHFRPAHFEAHFQNVCSLKLVYFETTSLESVTTLPTSQVTCSVLPCHLDDVLFSRTWITLYLALFIIPTGALKQLDFLRFTSMLAMLCFLFITISMIWYFGDDAVNVCNGQLSDSECGLRAFSSFNSSSDFLKFFKAAPVYCFAFGTHSLAFPLTNELRNANALRMATVIVIAFGITTMYYIGVGVVGYWTFGDGVESNVLGNYPQDSWLLFAVRIGLCFALTFSYPVVMNPCRQSLSGMLFGENAETLSNFKFYGKFENLSFFQKMA